MSLLTDYGNTLHGALDRNGNTISVLRNYAKNGTTFKDYIPVGAVDGGVVGSPGSTSGAGRDGTDLHSYGGTADGHDLGTALSAPICLALEDGVGVTVAWDMRHSNSADKDAIFDGVDASVRNGIRVGVNYNVLYNLGAHQFCCNMIDNAGNSRQYFWDTSGTRILTDGLTHQCALLLTKTAGLLYIDGTLMAITTTGGATLSTMNTSATHKYGFACTGFGASISTGEPFNGSAGNLLVCRGLLTQAQIRARLAIHISENRSTDGTPLTRVWRADTNAYVGAVTPPSDADDVDTWDSTDGQISMGEASADDPGSGVDLVPTYFSPGPFGSAACIGFDNVFSKNTYDADANIGGHRRQTMKSVSLSGLTFHGSNISMWFAARIPVWALLGNTVQNIIDLRAGGTRKVAISFQTGRLIIYGPAGAVRDASTTDVLDCRNGPSLVYGEITIAPDGTCTIQMNRWTGSTTSTLSVGNTIIDEIMFGGTQSGDGGDCAHCFAYEIGYAETVSTSTERAARLARIFSEYGAPGETPNPTRHMVWGADSLFSLYCEHLRSVVMRLPAACVNNTSHVVVDQQGQSIDAASNDFASHSMNAAAKKDPAATWQGLVIALSENDHLAGDTAAQINTDLGTAIASVSGYNWIGALGLHDHNGTLTTKRTDYQGLINARVGATLNAAINQRTTVGMLVSDTIHGAGDTYQQQLADDIWNNSSGGSGGGLASVLGASGAACANFMMMRRRRGR